MGKRKLKLQKSDNPIKRISAFKRRYTTIISKLIELTSFTGSRSLLIMYNGDTNVVYQYTSEFIDSFLASLEEFEGDFLNIHCASYGNEEIEIKSGLKKKDKGLIHPGSSSFQNSRIEPTILNAQDAVSELERNKNIFMETLNSYMDSNSVFKNSEMFNVDKYSESPFMKQNSIQENIVYGLLDEL